MKYDIGCLFCFPWRRVSCFTMPFRKECSLNVFEAVKDSVTTRQAAEMYGIQVRRNGMACCPFHRDKNPSMKVDRRFHCFGCQADGDVIDFTAQLFSLGKKDAAEKLADDFGIHYDRRSAHDRKKRQSVLPRIRPDPVRELSQWRDHVFDVLIAYKWKLRDWQVQFAPKSVEDEEWHPLFIEALRNKDRIECLLDELMDCSTDQLAEMKKCCGEEVENLDKRLGQHASRDASKDRDRQRNAGYR